MINKTLTGPHGVALVLDSEQVFPDDPGNGTPAIVYYKQCTATYWCALGEGEVQPILMNERVRKLPKVVLDWLQKQESEVEKLYEKNV